MTKPFTVQRATLIAALLVLSLGGMTTGNAVGAGIPTLTLRVGGTGNELALRAGQQFMVTASGFTPGESVKVIAAFVTYNGNSVIPSQTVAADARGVAVNALLYVPPGTRAGTANVAASGASSHRQANGHVTVIYRPAIQMSAASVAPNAVVAVVGSDFVAYSVVHIRFTIRGTGGRSQTLSVDTTANSNGAFTKLIRIPSYTAPGTYSVTATDAAGGFSASRSISVAAPAALPTATATTAPILHPTGRVVPSSTPPNRTVTFVGAGFPANAPITVRATLRLRDGSLHFITKRTSADRNGNFALAFHVPYKTVPSTYAVTATTSRYEASSQLQVLPRSSHPSTLQFRRIKLRYSTVRQGTWDRLTVQSSLHTRLGIWVHVVFPSGKQKAFYAETNAKGHWKKRFSVPRGSATAQSHTAFIIVQLWHGSQTVQGSIAFTVV